MKLTKLLSCSDLLRAGLAVCTLLAIVIPTALFALDPPPVITSVTGANPRATNGVGGPVYIHGTGFQSGVNVQIAGQAAIGVTVQSSILIEATPQIAAAGTYDVTVVNLADSQSGTLAGAVEYIDPPTITSVTPYTTVNIAGESVVITGTGLKVGANAVDIDGVLVSSTGNSTSITINAPAHAEGGVGFTVYGQLGDSNNGIYNNSGALYYGNPSITNSPELYESPAGGETVTIAGTGFRPGSTLTIGGDPVSTFSIIDDSNISMTFPAHAVGDFDLVLTEPDARTATAAHFIHYEAAPTVSSMSPTTGLDPAGGDVITVSGTGLGQGVIVDFGGTNDVALFSDSNTTHTTFTTPPHAVGSYLVQVFGPHSSLSNGISTAYNSLTYGFNLSGTVTFNSNPLVGVTVNGGGLGTATTDSSGHYSFTALASGTSYNLTVSKDGYIMTPSSASGTVTANTTKDFVATLPGVEVRGTITMNDAEGTPLAGAVVSDGTRQATTNNSGQFIIEHVPDGSYTLTAAKSGFTITAKDSTNPVAVSGSAVTGKDFTAIPTLGNPIYGVWDGRLGMSNIAELMNTGSAALTASITLIDADGNEAGGSPASVSIPAKSQRNIKLNSLPGFSTSSFGTIKFSFSANTFDGRMFYSRKAAKSKDNYDFAFSSPLTNPVLGKGFVTFNTFQPSGFASEAAYLVTQWLTVVNLADTSKNFTVKRYDHTGSLLKTESQTIGAKSTVNLEAGHVTPGPNAVGLIEVTPDDLTAPYVMTLVRYGSDSATVENAKNYQFAMSLAGQSASGTTSYVPVTNKSGSENYIELVNVSDAEVAIVTSSYDSKGNLVDDSVITLSPREQEDIYASALMPKGLTGYVTFHPATNNSVIAYSVVYKRKSKTGRILAAHSSASADSYGTQMFGSYDLYQKMTNWLSLINVSDEPATATIQINPAKKPTLKTVTIAPHSRVNLDLQKTKTLKLKPNQFGVMKLDSSKSGSVFSEVVREKPYTPKKGEKPKTKDLDFTVTTPVR